MRRDSNSRSIFMSRVRYPLDRTDAQAFYSLLLGPISDSSAGYCYVNLILKRPRMTTHHRDIFRDSHIGKIAGNNSAYNEDSLYLYFKRSIWPVIKLGFNFGWQETFFNKYDKSVLPHSSQLRRVAKRHFYMGVVHKWGHGLRGVKDFVTTALSSKTPDNGGRGGSTIVQNCVTSFMNDPML